MLRRTACLLLLSLTVTGNSVAAAADTGPALQVPQAQLERSLSCTPGLATASSDPILLTPAFSNARQSYGWNYLRQLPALGYEVCSLSLPDNGYGDLQRAAEYVVFAVRRMAAVSGRKVVVMGHQHGALDELWALRFWPDLAPKVSSLIALATPFQGTNTAAEACGRIGYCSPSEWQIAAGSQFLAALNARPLPAGPAYTSISTVYDEVIRPQPAASNLDGATHILLQDICPRRPIEHFSILIDNLSYRLVLDALTHPGEPANPQRLPATICGDGLYSPGALSLANFVPILRGLAGFAIGEVIGNANQAVRAEPPLRDYVGGAQP